MNNDCLEHNNHWLLLLQKIGFSRDQEAYRQLFMHFAVPATRFAASITKSEESAEEIYCDVLMKLWDMGEDIVAIKNFKLYLFQSIKNASLNHLQKQKRITIVSLDNITLSNTSAYPADEKMFATEFQQRAQEIINGLSPSCQNVFRLVRTEGFNYKETAALLDISVNTVEFHMKNALAKLKLGLAPYLHPQKNK